FSCSVEAGLRLLFLVSILNLKNLCLGVGARPVIFQAAYPRSRGFSIVFAAHQAETPFVGRPGRVREGRGERLPDVLQFEIDAGLPMTRDADGELHAVATPFLTSGACHTIGTSRRAEMTTLQLSRSARYLTRIHTSPMRQRGTRTMDF